MGKAKEMGALEVSRITRRGMNFVGGVAGLGMNVNAGGSRSWCSEPASAGCDGTWASGATRT